MAEKKKRNAVIIFCFTVLLLLSIVLISISSSRFSSGDSVPFGTNLYLNAGSPSNQACPNYPKQDEQGTLDSSVGSPNSLTINTSPGSWNTFCASVPFSPSVQVSSINVTLFFCCAPNDNPTSYHLVPEIVDQSGSSTFILAKGASTDVQVGSISCALATRVKIGIPITGNGMISAGDSISLLFHFTGPSGVTLCTGTDYVFQNTPSMISITGIETVSSSKTQSSSSSTTTTSNSSSSISSTTPSSSSSTSSNISSSSPSSSSTTTNSTFSSSSSSTTSNSSSSETFPSSPSSSSASSTSSSSPSTVSVNHPSSPFGINLSSSVIFAGVAVVITVVATIFVTFLGRKPAT